MNYVWYAEKCINMIQYTNMYIAVFFYKIFIKSLSSTKDFKYVNILSDCLSVYIIIATLIPIFIHFKQKTSSIKIITCHENDKVDVRDNLCFFLENINDHKCERLSALPCTRGTLAPVSPGCQLD